MKNHNIAFCRSLIAAAVALAFPFGSARADEAQELTSPNKLELSPRIQNINSVNPLYRMYSGMDRSGTRGSLDLNLINRSEDGGWTKILGQDLGLTGIQQFGASYEKQGDWRIGVGYNEITKYAPYTINTKVGGVGTDTLTLNQDWRSLSGIGPESSLKLERTETSLTGSKLFSDAFKFSFSAKSEDKKGAIMSSMIGSTINGIGGKNYSTMYFAPQPENFKHNQFEATLDYFTKFMQLSGGYYGSFFNNNNNALNITPGNNSIPTLPCASPASCFTAINLGAAPNYGAQGIPWIALPPDNHAQQLFLSGAFNFTDKTRLSFKWSKERLTQDDSFIPPYGGITAASATYTKQNPPGVPYASGMTNTSLNGLVETTSYFGMLTSKLSKDLDLAASWRYENRDDKTPQRFYLDSTASTEYPNGVTNPQESHQINRGKIDLNYRLQGGYRLVGGLDYDEKRTPEAYRDSVTDKTVRLEMRKSMSETVNGSFKISHSNRNGGAWHLLDGTPAAGATTFSTTTGVAAPLQFADRKRDKAKLMVEWRPIDPMSLQFFYEQGKDSYPFAPPSGNPQMGQTEGKTQLFGLDASYKINDDWKAQGYYSANENKTHQIATYTPRVNNADQPCTGVTVTTTCVPWTADLNLKGTVLGAGFKGKIARWDVGADYLWSKDTTGYAIGFNPLLNGAGNSVPAGAGILPNTTYSLNRLKLYGTYAISKKTRVRLDYIYDVRKMDDYTWASWTYSDGTRVNVDPKQTTNFVGVTLIQSF